MSRLKMRANDSNKHVMCSLLFLCLMSLISLDKGFIICPAYCRSRFYLSDTNYEAMSSTVDLTTAIRRHFSNFADKQSPFISPDDVTGVFGICNNITFTTDLIKGEGLYEYKAMAQTWSEACTTELSESTTSINNVATIRQNVVSVQWNVTFVPDAVMSIVWLSRRFPGTTIRFFNVLDKERFISSFSWASVRAFLERILYTGVVLLPHAVIVGKTELSFRETNIDIPSPGTMIVLDDESELPTPIGAVTDRRPARWILTDSKEKINLVRSVDAGLLKNRKLATDLLQFLDSRKPSTVALSDWNDLLVDRIRTRSIPGMGQFDIDGLGGKQSEIFQMLSRPLCLKFKLSVFFSLFAGII
jgi:hypothetical protein